MTSRFARLPQKPSAWILIECLPQEWQTRLGDIGERLSGWERQRFSIARALLKDAPIVVLDEPTAALDSESEAGHGRGYELSLSMLPELFEEILLVAQAGDWEEAELKRLEAYALFDPDIEQPLMPRAPALTLKMGAGFWEGNASEPGFARVILDKGPEEGLKQNVARMKAAPRRPGRSSTASSPRSVPSCSP